MEKPERLDIYLVTLDQGVVSSYHTIYIQLQFIVCYFLHNYVCLFFFQVCINKLNCLPNVYMRPVMDTCKTAKSDVITSLLYLNAKIEGFLHYYNNKHHTLFQTSLSKGPCKEVPGARKGLSSLKQCISVMFWCPTTSTYIIMKPIAHWCRRMTSYGSLNPRLRATHTHTWTSDENNNCHTAAKTICREL